MKIAIYSDTHEEHLQFPLKEKVDILVHCGDFTGLGKYNEVAKFAGWIKNLLDEELVDEVVMTLGNHELELSKNMHWIKEFFSDPQIHVLFDRAATVKGLKFYGSPFTPTFFDWAFMLDESALAEKWKRIPSDTDILVTHGPALGYLDSVSREPFRAGSISLRDRITEIKPLYHFFGHLHHDGGQIKEAYIGGQIEKKTTFINAACLDDSYRPRKKVPVIIEI